MVKKQSISLNDMAKLSRANKAKWYAEQGFDVLLGVRGRKGGGTGWNSPTRQAMTPQQAYATFNASNRTTNTVLHCGTKSKPMGSAGLLVVDVDIKNVRNDQERQDCHTALKAMLGEMYDYATVTSVSGGLHYYIAVPAHQAYLIPDTATLSLQSGEEYETQTDKGSPSKKKAWEIELLSTGKLIQAIPSKIGDKEYTINTGTIHQEIPPSIVSLIETWQTQESEPPEDTSAQITILEDPRPFVYCLKEGQTQGYTYSPTYVLHYHYRESTRRDGLYLAGTQKTTCEGVPIIEWTSPTRIGNVIYPLATLDDGKGYSFGMLLEFISQHEHAHRLALDLKQFVGDGMSLFSLLRELGYHWLDLPQYRQAIRLWLNNAKPDNRLIGKQECGWTNDYCFVLPDNVIGDDNGLYYYQGGVQRTDIYETKGDIDTWRNNIAKPIEPYPVLCLGIMLGFAAPLLRLLGIDTCGVHLWGESTNGKTTTARLGASVWGVCSKGTNGNNRIVSWNATATGFELQAALHSGSLLVLDEMGENKDEIVTTIYKLSDGRSKSRGQADLTVRASKTWQLLACSTGERKIQEHIGITKKLPVGVLMRFLEIPVNTSDGCGVVEGMTNKSERQAFITRLEDTLANHYGLACRPYLETLCAQLKQPEALSELKESYHSLVSDFSQGGTSQHARGAKVFAALALGGTLATQQGLTGWQASRSLEVAKLMYGRWREGFGEGVKEQSDFTNHLEAWLAQNIAHFAPVQPYAPHEFLGTGLEKSPHETIKPFYGYTTEQGDYWLLPMAFDTVREGISRDSAMTALYVKKWLVDPISAYQKGQTPRKTVAGKRHRLIHIRINNA